MAHTASASNLPLKPNPYRVNLVLATGAGAVAQFLWLCLYYPVFFAYGMDPSLDICRIFGSFLTPMLVPAYIAGFVIVMGIGVATAWAYALLLHILNLQSSGTTGTIYGYFVCQPIFAFVLPWTVGFLAAFTGVTIDTPDVLLNQVGHGNSSWAGMFQVMLAYLIYGLTLGAIYRHQRLKEEHYRFQYQGG